MGQVYGQKALNDNRKKGKVVDYNSLFIL